MVVDSPGTDDGSVIIIASNAVVRRGLSAILDDAGWRVATGDGPGGRQAVVVVVPRW